MGLFKRRAGYDAGILGRYFHPRAVSLLFLGFSAGLPYFLIFSTLSVWLREAGVARSAVTFFSWAALGYSFKFFWAPLVDLLPLPLLTRLLGRRRSWLFFAQSAIICSLVFMASLDPSVLTSLNLMALGAVALGFSAATQDIVIDAYRIECAEERYQALLSAMYIAGYRIGLLVAGAGTLVLARYLGSSVDAYSYTAWRDTYLVMAGTMLCIILFSLRIDEPDTSETVRRHRWRLADYCRILCLFVLAISAFILAFIGFGRLLAGLDSDVSSAGLLVAFLIESFRFAFSLFVAIVAGYIAVLAGLVNRDMARDAYVAPVLDFFQRYSIKTAVILLLLIAFYRLSDIVLGVVANIFYLDTGFSKNAIAGISKTFGLGMTLFGGFVGGFLAVRFSVRWILCLGAVLAAGTNLLFMLLAHTGDNLLVLTLVIGADNLAAGIATTAFVAFLSSLTSISYTATQYAMFSSLMTLFPKVAGGYAGTIVSAIGYQSFFLLTAALGVPVALLAWLVARNPDVGR
ncbi:MAG: MFS transporter [Deltaproteobacteria bacterium]|nr:MAG: MFS transporter [Deltaproteobacteria bacterium]